DFVEHNNLIVCDYIPKMTMIVADLGVLHKILKHFPKRCNYAFAYGSAVFLLPGKMIDLIFVANDPVEWHTENLGMNRSHYSKLKYFGQK
ncbi:Phosphatidate cytidylyltransferase, mitochondrial, partial [Orchesella cincta]